MDEALVPTAQRLKIRRSNFRLLSDIKSKESTLQLVYDVLHICPFFKAFLITADVPEIYMQEFWATATVHYHSIRFKMDNKKHIVDLELFKDILHICLRVHDQSFAETPFEDLRLSQAQMLWGLYHKSNVDYAYLMWEDFVYQVEHNNQKKRNEMYYPRFTKAIIHHFMSKDPSNPRRKKMNWHYVRDDHMFSIIKLCYAIAAGEAVPKPKANVRRTRSSFDTSITPPIAAVSPRLTASAKGKQTAKASKAKSLSALSEVAMTEAQQLKLVTKRSMQQTHISQPSGSGADKGTEHDDDGDEEDEGDDGKQGNGDDDEDNDGEEGDDDDADQEVIRDDDKDNDEEEENSEDEGNGEEDQGLNIGEEERHVKEEEEDELYRDVNINQGRGLPASLEVEDSRVTITLVKPDGMESIFGTTSQMDVQTPTSVAPLPITAPTMTFSTIATTTTISHAPILPTTFAGAVSSIPGIVNHYIDQRMNEAVRVAVQIQSDRLRDEAQRENDEFLTIVNENMKKIIKEQTLVDAYESDKLILDTYEETVTLKRGRDDDADKDKEPSVGPDRGSKRRREGKEPELASAPTKTTTRSAGRRIIAVTKLKIVEWHSYKHLDWIMVRRDDDNLYKFKEGDFKRLRIQDIEDMLLLLVQGKLTNLTVKERFSFNVSLRMFTRSIVIQRRVEDLQMGVESYQKKLNLTKPDSYRSDLKRKEAYTTYLNLQGFIY
nr:hypothetical protein [Tanacetum cinerariifolium]